MSFCHDALSRTVVTAAAAITAAAALTAAATITAAAAITVAAVTNARILRRKLYTVIAAINNRYSTALISACVAAMHNTIVAIRILAGWS